MGKATPVIVTVVAVVASIYAGPEVGAAILESMGVTGASATTTAAVGGAAISGSTSAVNTAIQGGNVEDVLSAGGTGAVSGAVGGAVGAQVPAGEPIGRGIASGGTGSATSAAIRGKDPVRAGITGAVAGGVTGAVGQALSDPNIGDVEAQQGGFYGDPNAPETGASPELTRFLAQSAGRVAGTLTAQQLADTPTRRGGTPRQAPEIGPTSTELGTTTTAAPGTPPPGSAALGQALRIGGGEFGVAGSPGEPIESPGGGEKTSRPVWNIASLRVKDETGGSEA